MRDTFSIPHDVYFAGFTVNEVIRALRTAGVHMKPLKAASDDVRRLVYTLAARRAEQSPRFRQTIARMWRGRWPELAERVRRFAAELEADPAPDPVAAFCALAREVGWWQAMQACIHMEDECPILDRLVLTVEVVQAFRAGWEAAEEEPAEEGPPPEYEVDDNVTVPSPEWVPDLQDNVGLSERLRAQEEAAAALREEIARLRQELATARGRSAQLEREAARARLERDLAATLAAAARQNPGAGEVVRRLAHALLAASLPPALDQAAAAREGR